MSFASSAAPKSENSAIDRDPVVAAMNVARSGSAGSGTSIVPTFGLPARRSLTSASFSSMSTNAMFSRRTCGLCAQLSMRTSSEDDCRLRRPGSAAGNTYDA